MEKENLEEKYPKLKKYLRFLTPDNIGQRTYAIEKADNEEILNEWINYWVEKDCIQASKIIVKLKNISEERKIEYKQKLILKILGEPDSLTKEEKLIIVYLYLGEFEKIEKLLKYLKWIQNMIGDIIINRTKTIEPEEMLSYMLNIKSVKKASSPMELQKILNKIIDKFREYDEFIDEHKKNELIQLKQMSSQLSNIQNPTEFQSRKEIIVERVEKLRDFDSVGKIKIFIGAIFTYIIDDLLKGSNYKLIFELIYLIEKTDLFYCLRVKNLTRLDKTPLGVVDDIIQKTINSMINKNKYAYAFLFLKKIKIKDYFKYIPKKENEIKYIELMDQYEYYINKAGTGTDIMNIKRELYIKSMYDGTNYEECLTLWLEYVKRYTTKVAKRSELLTIYELINLNIDNLDDEYVTSKLKEILDLDEDNINNETILKMQISVIEKIICSNFSLKEKVKKIQKLGKTNPFSEEIEFKYNENKKNNLIDVENSKRINIKNFFINLIEYSKEEELENILFLYMNTCLRYDLSLEKLILQLNNKEYKNIYEYINKHKFFGRFLVDKQSTLYYKLKILNVKTDNLTQVLKNTLEENVANRKNVFRIKIVDYSTKNNVITIQKIKESKNQLQNEVEKKLNIYKNAYKKSDLKFLSKENFVLDTDCYLEVAKFQIDILKKLNNENIENLIEDKINPFKFETVTKIYSNINNNTENIRDIINTQGQRKVRDINYNYMQYFTQEISKIYEKMFNENKIYINHIIFSYMNTIARYFLKFHDFISMVVGKIRKDEEPTVDISRYFKDYNIVCQDIVGNKIINPIQVNAKNLVAEEEYNEEKLCYYKFFLKEYDVYKKQIKVQEVLQVSILPKNSKQYRKIVDILNKYAKNPEKKEELLSEIKKIEKLPELQDLYYTVSNKHFEKYEIIYKIIVEQELEKGLKNLELFIKTLGENNYWKYNKYIIDNKVIKKDENSDADRIKDLFINQARKSDFETVMFCYNNTFIKEILPLNQLFDKTFKFNIFQTWEIDENNIINLEQYNLELDAIYVNKSQNNNFILNVKSITNQELLDIKIEKELNNINKEKVNFLKLRIKKYDIKNHIIYCKLKYNKILKDEKHKYCIQYLYEIDNILKNNYDIDQIYEYIKKPSVITENAFYYKTVNNKFFNRNFDSEECEETIKLLVEKYRAKFYKMLIKYITNNLNEEKINKNNLYKAFFIYDKTILRYIITLDKYLSYFRDIINKNEVDLKIYIKFKMNYYFEESSLYKIYIPRYSQVQTVSILNPNKIEIKNQQNYIAKIHKYDEKNNSIIFNYICDLSTGEAKILEDISEKPSNKNELINLIDNQICLINKITPKIIQQMYTERRQTFYFLKQYDMSEKESLENLKNICVENFIVKEEFIKKEIKKILNRFPRNKLDLVIYYYMNTAIRYILKLSDFLDLIIECYPDKFQENEGDFNISDAFKFYKMPIDSVKNNIIKSIQISDRDKIIAHTNLLKSYEDKDIIKGRICINKYNKNNKSLIVEKIYFREEVKK